jgi:hypothetical protein
MVRGLDIFERHFAAHDGQYVLIGGTALVLLMEEAGLAVRGTKDLDIVLCLEALDPAFVAAFWKFVELGGYGRQERGDGTRIFYRFQDPTDASFPEMLELFSRKPDVLTLDPDQHLTPIPAGQEAESLSAILLDDDYYAFLHARRRTLEGVPIVDEYALIPLKAYAWIKLTEEKTAGGAVDSKKILKHRNDILRLYAIVDPDIRIEAPARVRADLSRFLDALDPQLDLKPYGLPGVKPLEVAAVLKTVFGVVEQ